MKELFWQGHTVHARSVHNLGAICLKQDSRHRLIISVPEGAPVQSAALFLDGMTSPLEPVERSKHQLMFLLQTAAITFCTNLNVPVPEINLFWSNQLWGACDWQKSRVKLHYRLISMPQGVIEEALLHECCHLLIHDHSPAFWSLMTEQMPDWPYWEGILRQTK